MGLFNWKSKSKPEIKQEQTEQRSYMPYGLNSLFYNSTSVYSDNKAMLLSAVYRCVEVISDSVAQLPLEPYFMNEKGYKRKFTEHPTYWLLNREPNERMSRFTFIKVLVTSVLLKGNGYAYIERDNKGDAIALQFIPADLVTISQQLDGKVTYSVTGFKRLLEPNEILHILNFSYDGINGISTLAHARNTLELSLDSEAHAKGFFKGGANLAGIIKVESSLTSKQQQDIKESWQSTFNPQTGTPNGVAVLQGNMEFQPVTVNPVDAQLLETRKFNVIDVCRFFGVSPVKAFDLSNSSYSTVEATQLAFLTDTLAPLLEKIELEFERKLYKPSEKKNIDIRFDTSVLLRADMASQADYYNKLFQIGAISPNEIRKNLNMEEIADGDNTFCQVNVQTISQAVNKPVEKTE